MLSRKNLYVGISVALLIVTVLAFSSFILFDEADAQRQQHIDQSLSIVKELTQGEFGEPKIKEGGSVGDIETITIEDNKYEYRFIAPNTEMNYMIHKNYNENLKKGSIKTKVEAEQISRNYLQKYGRFSDTQMVLADYYRRSFTHEDTHQLTFEGVASNGVKTGDHARIVINNEGELLSFIRAKGNKSLAENVSTQITESKAMEIALNHLAQKYPELNKAEGTYEKKYEVKILRDKPIIVIKLDNVKVLDTIYGYLVHIDANTGEVLLDDYYLTLSQ